MRRRSALPVGNRFVRIHADHAYPMVPLPLEVDDEHVIVVDVELEVHAVGKGSALEPMFAPSRDGHGSVLGDADAACRLRDSERELMEALLSPVY